MWEIVSSLSVAAAAIFAAFAAWLACRQLSASRKSIQLQADIGQIQLFENIFRDIRELERQFYSSKNLSPEEKERGVITASTGNHGQSIALASKMFGVKAKICVPVDSNPDKLEAIRNYGAEIVEWGKEFEDARQNADRIAEEENLRYIHPANEPLLIAGVGTVGLEILEDLPDVDVVIVPVGGGSQASGISTVFKTVSSDVEIIGVQAEAAPSVYLSWKSGDIVATDSASTMADGLATRRAFRLTVDILRDNLDDFILVSEDEIKQAIRIYVEKIHHIAEGAGAVPLAAAIKIKNRLKNRKVVMVLSGGNLTIQMLKEIL